MNTAIIRTATDLKPGIIEIELPVTEMLDLAKFNAELERQIITRLTIRKEN